MTLLMINEVYHRTRLSGLGILLGQTTKSVAQPRKLVSKAMLAQWMTGLPLKDTKPPISIFSFAELMLQKVFKSCSDIFQVCHGRVLQDKTGKPQHIQSTAATILLLIDLHACKVWSRDIVINAARFTYLANNPFNTVEQVLFLVVGVHNNFSSHAFMVEIPVIDSA